MQGGHGHEDGLLAAFAVWCSYFASCYIKTPADIADIDKQEFNLVPLDLQTFIDFYVFY